MFSRNLSTYDHCSFVGPPPTPAFSDVVKTESMQSSIQYPMQSYQMTSGIAPGGPGQDASHTPGIHIHHGHTGQGLHHSSVLQGSLQGQAQPQQHQQFQRLKVEDALSYLDQVKFKFGNQPQVYNDFLDIMKEFKSQRYKLEVL